MKDEHNVRKLEVEELKEKIVEYFKKDNFDVTLSQLMKELKLPSEDLDLLEYCLDELVKEKWIEKSKSLDHHEFDPGEKLDFRGLK